VTPGTPAPVALGYARVSVADTGAPGGPPPDSLSVDAQRAAIVAACRERGLELVHVYADTGVSASVPLAERPAGAEMLLDLKARAAGGGTGAAIVAVRLDRLFRSASEALGQLDAWASAGHRPILLELGLDYGTPIGRFTFAVLASVAELERGLIRARTRDALAELRRQGRRTGTIPYGKRLGPTGLLEDHPGEQRALALIRLKRSEGWTPQKIADLLNSTRRELAPPRGERWHRNTIRRILGETP